MNPMSAAMIGTSAFKMLEDSGNQERQALLDAINIRYSPWLGGAAAGTGGGNGASVGDLAKGITNAISTDTQLKKLETENSLLDQLAGEKFKLLNGNNASVSSPFGLLQNQRIA